MNSPDRVPPGAVVVPFVKGHGTENDFLVVDDPGGTTELGPDLISAMCDRHAGVGADGVLAVVRTGDRWFMDYRNADGSPAETCGNGIRVFARYLADSGHVDANGRLEVDTRDGVKQVTYCPDGEISVDMGVVEAADEVRIALRDLKTSATRVDSGNPHAVAFVADLASVDLSVAPMFDPADFPDGVNVELVVRRGPHHVQMRVHERGVGETRSCGTGACAVAAALHAGDASPLPAEYLVDVPGGRLTVTLDEAGHAHLKGPAALTVTGTYFG